MKIKSMMLITAVAIGLSACADAGYYDNAGRYHTYPDAADKASIHKPAGPAVRADYTRRGYYDANGNYIEPRSANYMAVTPADYPRRGMCRVWFPDRAPEYQPPARTCASIRAMGVPDDAYVVFGG
jgi:hypothetical protein